MNDVGRDDPAVAWAMVEASPDALVMVDESGVIELVNRQTETMFGYARGELLGRPVEVLLPERFAGVHRAHRTRYRVAPEVRAMGSDLELVARRADGSEFRVEVSLSPVEVNEEVRIIAAVRDITARTVAATETMRIRRGVDALVDGVYMFDPDSWEFTYVNEGGARQTGHSVAELLDGMTALHFASAFTRVEFGEFMAPLLAGETDVLRFETMLMPRSGMEFPVEVVMECPSVEGDDHRVVITVVRDISERVEAERWAHLIQHTIDSVSDAVFVCDEHTLDFIYVNQGAADMHGYTREELLAGMTPAHLAPDLPPTELAALVESLADEPGRTARVVTEGRAKDGSRLPVQVHINWPRPPDPGAPRPIVAVVRDISEDVAAAAREQQLQSLAGAVSRVRLAMLSGSTRAEGLGLVCQAARETLSAVTAAIVTPIGEGPELVIEASSGIADDVKSRLTFRTDVGLVGSVFGSGRALVTDQPHQHPDTPETNHEVLNEYEVGSLIIAPLPGDGVVAGVLLVSRSEGADPFTEDDLDPVGQFASSAVTAIELAAAREARAALELLEDRERIARDMHDKVIGRLFATGMSLQSSANRAQDPEIERRLSGSVTEIDEAIKDIRTSIYGLRSQLEWGRGIKGDILAVAADHEPSLGFEPGVTFSGAVDGLPAPIVDELTTALREALTNAGKHANASEIRVDVTVTTGEAALTVVDNGRGFDPDAEPGSGGLTGNGLRNLTTRAEALMGSMVASSAPGEGTTITWTVPLT